MPGFGITRNAYNSRMDKEAFADLAAWLTQAGLGGVSETDILSGFCERCVAAGLPLGRALVAIDTLHPIHEGRVFRWGVDSAEPAVFDYGRTDLETLVASGSDPTD